MNILDFIFFALLWFAGGTEYGILFLLVVIIRILEEIKNENKRNLS